GCASGEESWSIVMTLLGPDRGAGRALSAKDVRVLATDIADHALKTAAAASYPVESIEAVPPALRAAWTIEKEEQIVMADDARGIVRFRS
ncbi:CheR family methyltransferase, partial [Acinetobacter baumannii]